MKKLSEIQTYMVSNKGCGNKNLARDEGHDPPDCGDQLTASTPLVGI